MSKVYLPSYFNCMLRYPDAEDRIFNRVVSIISVVRRETTFTVLDSIETVSPVESEIVRVAFLSISELTEITRFKKKLMDTLVSLSW